ncbi:PH domain-containing protein [Staphylococcus lutrae]|uniref:YdbS-like PH domain-containing protein n=1 Tax=Staphylococcus lutrae TaxID=155085 RepID=A0AAC9RS49_9STAP|nr:PH domain-containing protein [Staphylococcus lutrae]ARJ50244.1 hypothetical protein B5P37_02390 [Staphylococcus lutrae]PNZ37646.1 hypothetical protein CD134_05970 [Staphylococcus lutrae]
MHSTFQRSPKATYAYLKQVYFLKLLFILAVLSVFTIVWLYFEWPMYGVYFMIGIAVIVVLYCFIHPMLIYHFYHYCVTTHVIEIKKNWWFNKHDVIKIERIQYVERKTGLLMRRHRLSRLICFTAGHNIAFPVLFEEEVQYIESHCLEQIKGGDSDV